MIAVCFSPHACASLTNLWVCDIHEGEADDAAHWRLGTGIACCPRFERSLHMQNITQVVLSFLCIGSSKAPQAEMA